MWAEGRARTCPRTARGATPRAPCTRRDRAHTSAARVAPAWTRAHSQEVGTQALPPPTPSGGRGSGRAPGRSGDQGRDGHAPRRGRFYIATPRHFPLPISPNLCLSVSEHLCSVSPPHFYVSRGFPLPLVLVHWAGPWGLGSGLPVPASRAAHGSSPTAEVGCPGLISIRTPGPSRPEPNSL